MKKALVLFLCLSLLLLSGCAKSESIAYEGEEHTHVFGPWYVVTPVTCTKVGEQIRYCRICHMAVTEEIPIAADIAERAHSYEDTVVPPTESAYGYTSRHCTVCGHDISRTDEKQPLYALLPDSETKLTKPEGSALVSLLLSDTATHRVAHILAADSFVSPDLARRFALTLTVTEELEKENAVLTADTAVTVAGGKYDGRSFKISQLLSAYLKNGDTDAAQGFNEALGITDGEFALTVAARMQKLGLSDNTALTLAGGDDTATLADTAVLYARVLDTPILLQFLQDAVPDLASIGSHIPAIYLTDATGSLRVSALSEENGVLRFAVVSATALPGATILLEDNAETAIY